MILHKFQGGQIQGRIFDTQKSQREQHEGTYSNRNNGGTCFRLRFIFKKEKVVAVLYQCKMNPVKNI